MTKNKLASDVIADRIGIIPSICHLIIFHNFVDGKFGVFNDMACHRVFRSLSIFVWDMRYLSHLHSSIQ